MKPRSRPWCMLVVGVYAILCTHGRADTDQPQGEEMALVWGGTTNDLQSAFRLVPAEPSYALGERVDVLLHVRNVGTNTIRLLTSAFINGENLIVRDEEGKQQRVAYDRTGLPKLQDLTCAPGEVVVFKAMGIRFLDARVPQPERFSAYQMRCRPGQYWLKYTFTLPNPLTMSDEEANDYKNTGMFPSRIGNWVGELETGEAVVMIVAPQEKQ